MKGTYFKAIWHGDTMKAHQVTIQDEKSPRWIPKSDNVLLDITDGKLTPGETIDIEIADWFCEKEGIS